MIRQDIEETTLYSFNYVVRRVRGAISTCAASARGGSAPGTGVLGDLSHLT